MHEYKLSRRSALSSVFVECMTFKKLCNERTISNMKYIENKCWSGLIVNSCLEAVAIASTKLDVIGVNLQVIEVKKLEFHILLKIYVVKQPKTFCRKVRSTRATADICWLLLSWIRNPQNWFEKAHKFVFHVAILKNAKWKSWVVLPKL